MTKLLSIAFVLSLAGARVAAAQAPAPAPATDVAALEASGNKHYELAEYDAAIADFKEAFRISDEPGFLYNIAQAYRLKKDCREAATFYKNYLRRVPKAPNAVKIKSHIKAMETCAKTQPPPAPEPAPVVTPTPVVTPPPQPVVTQNVVVTPAPAPAPAPVARENARGWMKWGGIASLGVGAVGLGLGVKFGLDGRSIDDDIAACSPCTSETAKRLEDDGKAANRNMVIATVAGGALVATGVVFLVLWRGGEQEVPPASVSLTPGGATASFAWQF